MALIDRAFLCKKKPGNDKAFYYKVMDEYFLYSQVW